MHIKLDKIYENEIVVTYLIETEVRDESSRQVKYKYIKAHCTFDKKTEEISFDKSSTDPYYLNRTKEPAHILYHLRELNQTKEPFPEIYDIVTC